MKLRAVTTFVVALLVVASVQAEELLVTRGDIFAGRQLRPAESPAINNAGDVAFYANFSDGTPSVFLRGADGTEHLLAQQGEVFADVVLSAVSRSISINDGGDIVFDGREPSPGSQEVFHRSADGTEQVLVRRFTSFAGQTLNLGALEPSINNVGDVAFRANFHDQDGQSRTAIFLLGADDSEHLLIIDGDTVAGHTLLSGFPTQPSINDVGDLAFHARFEEDGVSKRGVFLISADGSESLLAASGDTIEGHELNFAAFPSLNNLGQVAFMGNFSDNQSGVFLASADGSTQFVVGPGDTIADRTLTAAVSPSINDHGDIAFDGRFVDEDGMAIGGVFLLPTDANTNPVAVAFAVDQNGDAWEQIVLHCESPDGTAVLLDGSQSFDPDNDPLTFNWSVDEGSGVIADPEQAVTEAVVGLGVHIVTLTVEDGRGGFDTADVKVTVIDNTPPVAEVTTDVASIWPPNNKMVPVTITALATDECTLPDDLLVFCKVSSSQPDDSDGTGEHTGDVNGEDGYSEPVPIELLLVDEGTYAATILLRAERDGDDKGGREYSILIQAVDLSGNSSTASCVVVVPHNQRRNQR